MAVNDVVARQPLAPLWEGHHQHGASITLHLHDGEEVADDAERWYKQDWDIRGEASDDDDPGEETDEEVVDEDEEDLYESSGMTMDSHAIHVAAALVRDTIEGDTLPFRWDLPECVNWYRAHQRWRWIPAGGAVVNLLISVLHTTDPPTWGWLVGVWWTLEVLLPLAFLAECYVLYKCMLERFWTHRRSVALLVCAVLQLLDVVALHGRVPGSSEALVALPSIRVLITRPAILVIHHRRLLLAVHGVLVAGKALVPVLLLLLWLLGVFSMYAFIVWRGTGKEDFDTLPHAFYQFFQALTTNNMPEVMISHFIHPRNVTGGGFNVTPIPNGHLVTQQWRIEKVDTTPSSILDWDFVSVRLSPLLFILFSLMGPFFLLSIAFAVVYDVYKAALEAQVLSEYHTRQCMLRRAFGHLTRPLNYLLRKKRLKSRSRRNPLSGAMQLNHADVDDHPAITRHRSSLPPLPEDQPSRKRKQRVVPYEIFAVLMREVVGSFSGDVGARRLEVMYHALGGGRPLTHSTFQGLDQLLQVTVGVETVQQSAVWRRIPALRGVLDAVRKELHVPFLNVYLFGTIAFAAAHYQYLATHPGISPHDHILSRLLITELVLGVVFDIDTLLRIAALGWRDFWKRYWNRFTFVIHVLTVGVYLVFVVLCVLKGSHEAALVVMEGHSSDSPNSTPDLINLIILGRLLLSLRAMATYRPFRVILATVTHLIPILTQYVVAMLLVLYVYAAVGMVFIGGVTPPPGTIFAVKDCYGMRFDSFYAAFVAMFGLMVQNNMFETIDGYRAAAGDAVLIFFTTFWVLAVLLVANVVIALVVDLFVTQWGLRKLEQFRSNPLVTRILECNLLDENHPLSLPMTAEGWLQRWSVSYNDTSHNSRYALECLFLRDRGIKHCVEEGAE